MTPFTELSKTGQARRLAALARAALPAWPISPVRLTLLHLGHNATFRVDDADGERYVLRVHRPSWQTDAAIGSEMDWLTGLSADTEIVVPGPVRTRTDEWLTKAQTDGVPEARQCVLFRWVSGRFRRRQAGAASLAQVGQLMARLHDHAEQWTPPAYFTRKRWDADGLLGPSLGIDWAETLRQLSADDQTLAETMAERLRTTARELGDGPNVFGLIHADLHFGNVLFQDGNIRAIDFDDCGWGWYLYDMAVPLATLAERAEEAIRRDAFLRGYRSVRALSAEHEKRLRLFVAVRQLAMGLWLASHREEPHFRGWVDGAIARRLGEARRFLGNPD